MDNSLKIKVKVQNQLLLWLFCALIGATSGAVVWLILKIMSVGMEYIWEWVPGKVNMPIYTVVVCVIGAAIIGIFHKRFGDYPEELEVVMYKVKTEKKYDYSKMIVMMIGALLPLLMGSSVGPEAGLTGIIVGLCYWAGDNLKFAKVHKQDYSKIGVAVSLSVLFHAPLFGIFQVEEGVDNEVPTLSKESKIFVYGIALAAGTGIYTGLSTLFGAGLSGFPSFDITEINKIDYSLMIVYILGGLVLAFFFQGTHHVFKTIAEKIPPVLKEIIAGLALGIIGTFLPAVMFSGEEQMGELMETYKVYLPIALIGVAFLKVALTNLCIQFGLKGGHFFPVIFAGVCMGYGMALLICGPEGNVVFSAAIVTASLLGGIMKKPLAVTMLLFLCFPIKMFIWIFLAAVVGSKCIKIFEARKVSES